MIQDIKSTEADRANGTITVGGVDMNPSEALAFANIARAGVINEVGFERLNEAQELVDNMKKARQVLQTVTRQKDLYEDGHVNYGWEHQIIFTKEQTNFLSNEVGRATPLYEVNVKIGSNSLDSLPSSIVQAGGLQFDEEGRFLTPSEWYVPSDFQNDIKNEHNLWKEKKDEWDNWPKWDNSHPAVFSENYEKSSFMNSDAIENFYAKKFEDNGTHGPTRVGRGVTENGTEVFRNRHNEIWFRMEGGSVHKDKAERLEEELKHFIEQMGNDNSLHMSKTKNLLGQGNNATEAANSMLNSNKDKVDKLITNIR